MWWQTFNIFIYLCVILFALLLVLAVEAVRHRRALSKIRYRVHVNGTRGKSSVTRLIAAGLRAGGIRTFAKTTGTLPRFIDHEGNEEAIFRIGFTNVIEQVGIIKRAARLGAEALVIECMALQPLLQSLCELRIVKSTHGVVTNARADHLDVMGPAPRDVALALAGTMPVRGAFFTAEKKHLNVFEMAGSDRRSKIIAIDDEQVASISDEMMSKFSYVEFKENVALALAVCEAIGVSREKALAGMHAATPDPGALSVYTYVENDVQVTFANGFAANDPDSTKTLWEKIVAQYAGCELKVLVVNCRHDRPDRTAQIAEAIKSWSAPDKILLIGSGTKSFAYYFKKSGGEVQKIISAESWSAAQIIAKLSGLGGKQVLAVGVGNIAKIGLSLVAAVKEKSC